jgi:hypothetical protein
MSCYFSSATGWVCLGQATILSDLYGGRHIIRRMNLAPFYNSCKPGRRFKKKPLRGTAWPHLASPVESWVKNTDEQFFAVSGGFFSRALIELNARHAMQQSDDAARQPLRVGDSVAGQSFPQIACFANV